MTTPQPPPDPFHSVVTSKDIYDATRETQSDVRAAMARVQNLETAQADQETRLRALERWRWGTGAACVGVLMLVADSPLAALMP